MLKNLRHKSSPQKTHPGARLVHRPCTGVRLMSSRKRKVSPRFRVGKVSVYLHHGTWWLDYGDGGQPVRRKAAEAREAAEQLAAQVNAHLTSGAPPLLSFSPIGVPGLRQQFLDYHEHVLKSSIGTVRRYR